MARWAMLGFVVLLAIGPVVVPRAEATPATPATAMGLQHDCRAAAVGARTAMRTEYRPGLDDPRDAGGMEIVAIALTSQCADVSANGAYVPAGLRAELYGRCPSRPCGLGTTVLTEEFVRGTFHGTLRDAVGFRDITIGTNRKDELVMRVRTRIETKGPATTADYLLLTQPSAGSVADSAAGPGVADSGAAGSGAVGSGMAGSGAAGVASDGAPPAPRSPI